MTDDTFAAYDWTTGTQSTPLAAKKFDVLDETLRDGIQSPSVVDPKLAEKIEFLHLTSRLGVRCINLGLPGAGPKTRKSVLALTQEVARARLPVVATAAARTVVKDLEPIVDIAQATGVALEPYTFIGSSPVRFFAEGWSLERVLQHVREAISFCVRESLSPCLVTEDTTRSPPEVLEPIFRTAIELGARRLCLADTVGQATPDGIRNLFAWTRALIRSTGADVQLDWHGHNDRGLAVSNALFAIECGADRVHGTGLGVGERVGNVATDQLLVNLKLLGAWPHDLTGLVDYCHAVERMCHTKIPPNYPLAGRDAFRTATGVHAAAIIKAKKKGDEALADRVYSSVPASDFGCCQTIEISHMSGLSNVKHWLEQHGIAYDDTLAAALLARAKRGNRTLKTRDVLAFIAKMQQPAPAPRGRVRAATKRPPSRDASRHRH